MRRPIRQNGFSLVELMIALVLGLMVIGGVSAVFLSNKESYRSNNALSQVQENSRIAFELLARDIRQAGLTGCGNGLRVANVLRNQGTDWWANFGNAVRGYDQTQTDPAVGFGSASPNNRVAGTDSIQLIGVEDAGMSIAGHNANSAQIALTAPATAFAEGDIVMICHPGQHAAITQIKNPGGASNVTIVHNTGNSTSPGNCWKGLGFPSPALPANLSTCDGNAVGNAFQFPPNSQIAALSAADWYIGSNPQGGRSLYRRVLRTQTGVPGTVSEEMVRNVTDMQLQYLVSDSSVFVNADAVSNAQWTPPLPTSPRVIAVRATLTLRGVEERTGTDAQPITRQFSTTVALRNRVD